MSQAFICDECVLTCVGVLEGDKDYENFKIAYRQERRGWLKKFFR
jgi:hypothetical protein